MSSSGTSCKRSRYIVVRTCPKRFASSSTSSSVAQMTGWQAFRPGSEPRLRADLHRLLKRGQASCTGWKRSRLSTRPMASGSGRDLSGWLLGRPMVGGGSTVRAGSRVDANSSEHTGSGRPPDASARTALRGGWPSWSRTTRVLWACAMALYGIAIVCYGLAAARAQGGGPDVRFSLAGSLFHLAGSGTALVSYLTRLKDGQ